MKKIIVYLFVSGILLTTTNCKKDSDINSLNTFLQGKWELRDIYAMLPMSYPPGNGRTISFAGNNYIMHENGQIKGSGQFKIFKDNSAQASSCLIIAPGEYENRIQYDGISSDRKIFFQLANDSLFFISGCFAIDAGSKSTYVKL